ncbi:hypothetical protein E2320_003193 [Naja naja]|nr:hypothetical protein E2320_003193 [Naja naja]
MQKQPVEELIISSKRRSGYKRPAESGEENYPVPKKRCRYVLICPMEKEFSLLPQNRECNYFSTDEEKIPWEGIIDPSGLLRSVLSPFPLGLRLNKLKNMVWSKHNIQLLTLSLQQGFKDSLHFLEAVPGIILKFNHRRPFRCIVQLDQGSGVPYHSKASTMAKEETCLLLAKFQTDFLNRTDTSRKKRV